ncbi:MAG: glutaredoxin [Ignavibacteria bacterium]|nr:glutaredoxin [Ignavibacteria bacterium]
MVVLYQNSSSPSDLHCCSQKAFHSYQSTIRERLAQLKGKVRIINFTQELECEFCKDTRKLVKDVSELSNKISFESYDFVSDKEKVQEFNIDKIPATVVMGDRDYGIIFYGIPAGYEFASLLEAIEMVGKGQPTLSTHAVAKVKDIKKPVRLQVFVTPTCPYCPAAVVTTHQLAMANPLITADWSKPLNSHTFQ